MRTLDLVEMENIEGGSCEGDVAWAMIGGAILGGIFGGPAGAIIGMARGAAVSVTKCFVEYDW